MNYYRRRQRRQIDFEFTSRSSGIGSSADKPMTLLQHVLRHLKSHVDNEPLILLANKLFPGKEGTKIASEEEGFQAYLEVMRHDMEHKSATTQRILQDNLHVVDGALRDSILGDFHYILHGLDVMNHRLGAAGTVHAIEDEDDNNGVAAGDDDDENNDSNDDLQQQQQQKCRKRTYTLYKADELYDYFGVTSS